MDYEFLSTLFKIDKTQFEIFNGGQDKLLSNLKREFILNKFADQIIDSTYITETNYCKQK